MNMFYNILAKMKRWLLRGHAQQVEVRTFVGDFVVQRKGANQPASYDEYLQYAESSPPLQLVATDILRVEDGKVLKYSSKNFPDGIGQFNQDIAVYCSDFASYILVLKNKMK